MTLSAKKLQIRRRAMINILDQKLKEPTTRRRVVKNLSFEEFELKDSIKDMKRIKLTVVNLFQFVNTGLV